MYHIPSGVTSNEIDVFSKFVKNLSEFKSFPGQNPVPFGDVSYDKLLARMHSWNETFEAGGAHRRAVRRATDAKPSPRPLWERLSLSLRDGHYTGIKEVEAGGLGGQGYSYMGHGPRDVTWT